MTDRAFFFDVLYPFQDRVIHALAQAATGFYLTGSTAASRGYLHHRLSDDLDFFVNDDNRFGLWSEQWIQTLVHTPGWQFSVPANYPACPELPMLRARPGSSLSGQVGPDTFVNWPARIGQKTSIRECF